ncbi:UNVERIFIED_CONTAM: acyl-CoA reductase-like NAD-dependent aldehyde dehydrogenase [Streptomyces graminofaciens]
MATVTTELRRLRNYINGEFKDAADGRTIDIVNPATGEVYATSPLSGQADVDAAMDAAAAAFPAWRDTTPAERQKVLLKIADAIEERAEDLIAAESENTGKPIGLTRTEEIPPMVDQIRFFAGAARMLEGRSAGEYMEGLTSIVRREPVGVCAQVAPWNYPMMMAVWKFAPALAAGNTVVLKPSDTTPASTVLMAEIIGAIAPKGVFNVVCGDRDTGRAMVEHPVPAMASITGSVRAGIQVAASAAKDVKRVHLELGGKAPVVVFEDTDIDKAVEDISVAGFFNAGQDCTAATRVLVHESIHDEFVSALAKAAAATKTGAPDDEDVLYGPLNNANQLDQVTGFIDRLPAHAKVEAGGQRVGDKGYFYAPNRRLRSQAGRRDHPERGLRPGHHRPVLLRRGPGPRVGERRGVRAGLLGVDQGPRAGDADVQGPRLRLRVDQHPHPTGRRDAPRRLQEVRLRQGPVGVRLRRLHAHQARDDVARRLTSGPFHNVRRPRARCTRAPGALSCGRRRQYFEHVHFCRRVPV